MLQSLKLHNWRNIKSLSLGFSQTNIIYAPNGFGKTNILEAIGLLGLGRSPLGSPVQDMISFGSESGAVEGATDRGLSISVRLHKDGRKDVYLNEKRAERLSDILGHLPISFIGPREVVIVVGSPVERRRMLDLYLCQMDSAYTAALRSYNRYLSERNAFLKHNDFPLSSDNEILLDAIEKPLAEKADVIVEARRDFILRVEPEAGRIFDTIRGANDRKLTLSYRPSHSLDSPDDFIHSLHSALHRDFAFGSTSLGPHRDEIEIAVEGRSAREFASWGEARIASIAILLAAAGQLFQKGKMSPTLLLDDCFAELDTDKTARLLKLAPEWGQVFVASPKKLPTPPKESVLFFNMDNPGIVRENITKGNRYVPVGG